MHSGSHSGTSASVESRSRIRFAVRVVAHRLQNGALHLLRLCDSRIQHLKDAFLEKRLKLRLRAGCEIGFWVPATMNSMR